MVDVMSLEDLIARDDEEGSSSSEDEADTTIDSSSSSESDDSSDEHSLSSFSSSSIDKDTENGLIMTLAMVHNLRRSTSAGNLFDDGQPQRRNSASSDGYLNAKKGIAKAISVVQTRSADQLPLHQRLAERNVPSPLSTYEKYMKDRDVAITYLTSDYLREREFFVHGSQVGYSLELVNAVSKNDMRHIRKHFRNGGSLQCCNRFGESLVHAVVRKGTSEMLQFLIEVAKVSVQVCCDGGRTPLHDGCWSATPNFEMIRCLLVECPDLLLVTDKRGFSPLQYIPRDSFRQWNEFLGKHEEILIPKGIVTG